MALFAKNIKCSFGDTQTNQAELPRCLACRMVTGNDALGASRSIIILRIILGIMRWGKLCSPIARLNWDGWRSATRAGIPATAASRYLTTLRELGLVRRDVPFTERHPEKSKRGLYVVADPFVWFWCRFILPHQSLIQAGQGETVWREFIRPQ